MAPQSDNIFTHDHTHSHLCLVFDCLGDYRAAALAYISHGLLHNEKCIMATDAYKHGMIHEDFEKKGIDITRYINSGQMVLLDVHSSYSGEGMGFDPEKTLALWVNETQKALAENFTALRVVGEATFGIGNPDLNEKLIYYENILNQHLFPHHPFKSMCVYDRRLYPPEIIKAAIKAHPSLLFNNTLYKDNIYYIPPKDFLGKNRQGCEIDYWLENVKKHNDNAQALHESERRFRMLFNHAPLSYQSLDIDGNFLEVNETWLQVMGYTREEVIGKNFSDFLHPDWQEHFRTNFPRFKAVGEVLGVEFEMVKKDGSLILVSFHGKVTNSPEGEFRQTHCVFRDIGYKRRMEAERVSLERKLRQAQKMEAIGTLAGGIAHDFNNTLFPILGFTEILQKELPPDSHLQAYLDQIYKAAVRSKDLVHQILTFSRRSDNDLKSLKPLKVQSIIKEALKMLRASIPTTIEIKHDISRQCGTVLADAVQVHQIIMNLATNAYHAMEPQGGILSVELKQVSIDDESGPEYTTLTSGEYALIKIADTGAGIEKKIMDKIFEPYFTTKENGKGTGLGLSMVQGIVHTCGGDMDIDSTPGTGTTIRVYLPIKTVPPDNYDAIAQKEMKKGNESILLVDDEQAIIKVVTLLLQRLGYRVTSKTDPTEALEAFRANPDDFDLLVTDMTMPHMTGLELAMEIKKIVPAFPVIICTGFSEQIDIELCRKNGIEELLDKPVTLHRIASSIRKIFQEKQDHSQEHVANTGQSAP